MKTHAKLTRLSLCQRLLGERLGTNQNGNAGRMLEDLLESWGVPINRGAGPDILVFGCEIKSRARSATSSQTIADMNIQDIRARSYRDSQVREKFQQQLRVFTENGTVVDAGIYDFSSADIQDLVEQAYEHARAQLIQNSDIDRTAYTGFYGYFERRPNNSTTWSFRLSPGDMAVLEGMARSTFNELFEYTQS